MVFSPLLALAQSAGNTVSSYCLLLSSLTPKDGLSQVPVAGPSGAPTTTDLVAFSVYAPIAIFFTIFAVIFGAFVIYRIKNWRLSVTAFLLAVTVASTPFIFKATMGTQQGAVNAGPDEIPRTIKVQAISLHEALILWDTDAVKIGAVRISPVPFTAANARTIVGNLGGKTTTHTVAVTNLTIGKKYEFEILSGARWYDNNGIRPIFTFTR